jgi:hypothetical protein
MEDFLRRTTMPNLSSFEIYDATDGSEEDGCVSADAILEFLRRHKHSIRHLSICFPNYDGGYRWPGFGVAFLKFLRHEMDLASLHFCRFPSDQNHTAVRLNDDDDDDIRGRLDHAINKMETEKSGLN